MFGAVWFRSGGRYPRSPANWVRLARRGPRLPVAYERGPSAGPGLLRAIGFVLPTTFIFRQKRGNWVRLGFRGDGSAVGGGRIGFVWRAGRFGLALFRVSGVSNIRISNSSRISSFAFRISRTQRAPGELGSFGAMGQRPEGRNGSQPAFQVLCRSRTCVGCPGMSGLPRGVIVAVRILVSFVFQYTNGSRRRQGKTLRHRIFLPVRFPLEMRAGATDGRQRRWGGLRACADVADYPSSRISSSSGRQAGSTMQRKTSSWSPVFSMYCVAPGGM